MNIARPKTGRMGLGVRMHLPTSWKGWGITLLVLPLLALLAMGLAQAFHLGFGGESSERVAAPDMEWREMIEVLNRSVDLQVKGLFEEVGLDVLLVTPQYLAATRRQTPAGALEEPSLLFYLTETTHIDDLPDAPPQPLLRIGSAARMPVETVIMADSYHHRTTRMRYAVEDILDGGALQDGSIVELVFPAPEGADSESDVLRWRLPLEYSSSYSSAEVVLGSGAGPVFVPSISGVAVLAVLGGLLAAMWPCLFQLTAYFIPAMAGMSMSEASTAKGMRPRVGVVKVAFFFVLGFTIVYTLAGAVIGFGSQQLSNLDSFYQWQRYVSIGAGVVLIGLALRVAARARAPLVCKMPLLRRTAKSGGMTSPWESMLVGVTFATGCMTCFGSAVLVGMVLYVGLEGSPLVGATLLFLFSIGMGVPLVIGAIAMAKVLPTLFKMEKAIPWMGLASAVLIAGYGVLLISGNFMALTRWFYQISGISSPLS